MAITQLEMHMEPCFGWANSTTPFPAQEKSNQFVLIEKRYKIIIRIFWKENKTLKRKMKVCTKLFHRKHEVLSSDPYDLKCRSQNSFVFCSLFNIMERLGNMNGDSVLVQCLFQRELKHIKPVDAGILSSCVECKGNFICRLLSKDFVMWVRESGDDNTEIYLCAKCYLAKILCMIYLRKILW